MQIVYVRLLETRLISSATLLVLLFLKLLKSYASPNMSLLEKRRGGFLHSQARS